MKFKFRDYVGGIIICLLSMFAVIGTVHGQNRLNVDLAVPNLAVENGAKTFRVRINKTATACNDGKLRIKLPNGFKYVSGSAKIDGNNPASEDLTDDALTLPLGSIGTLGTGADYIEVKFDVEAFCPALLVSSTDRYVDYTLTGCGVPTEGIKGKSNVINLLAAVLNISVTPALEQAVVGQTLIRTITIKNSGTGDIKKFKIPVNYGTGITRLPTAEQTTLPQGITYDEEAKSYFYDGDFVSGASLTITEKVKINGCVGLASTYEVTYGSDCVRHTGDKTSVAVQIDDSKRPRVVVSDESAPQTVCMGGTYTHIWKIKNTGNAPASLVELGINASTIEGNVDVRGGNGATAVAGSVVRIDVLAPDEELTVTFTQRYTAPTSNADCATAPTEYTTASTGYTLSYKHIEGCIGGKTPEYASSATTKQSLTLAFNGDNVGEEDIIGGMPYHADFKIGTWSFPEDGLDKDAYLEIVIDLSADLSSSDLSTTLKLFNGANDVGVTINKANDLQYKIRLDRSALIQSTEGNWRLKFPLTLTCPTTAGNPFYKITTTLFNCGNAITFACETVGLSAVCPEGDCPNGGMQKGTISLERITLGLEDKNNDGIPDNANSASDLGESIRSFVGGDIIEISQQGIVGAPQNDATYLWKSGGRFEVTVADPNLGMVATGLFGKVEVTRGATVFPFDNIPVQSANGKFFIALPSGNIATGFDGFVNGDKVIASLQLKATKANEKTELKRFTTSYGLYHESDLNTLRSCGNLDKVSGYYVATELTVGTVNGTYNIPTCESGQEGAGLKIDFAIDGDNYRNALFPDEFREITKPKTITFNVSAGLTMTGYRVELQGNGAVPAFIDVNTLSISGATHTIDAATLANHLRALKGNRIEGAIDEGFTFVVRPIVTPNCNAGLEETITIDATVDGSFNLGATNHIGATDVAVASQTLKYKTDNDKLEVNVLQVSTVSYTNEAKWLLKVSNRSEFREFQNFWLGKTAGTVNISSVKEVKSLTDMTEVTSGITESGGVYNLKSVNAEQSRYFLITASVVNCADGSIEFAYGNDCKGVPSTVADAICKTNYAETLKFVLVDPILQTTVIDDPGAEQIPICEPITYVVEINNAGGEAKELKLNIKMASFLNYVGVGGVATEAKMSTVYTTRPDPSAITFSRTITGVTFDPSLGEAVITIPANLVDNSLQNAERFYLQFQLQVANCEFKSGQTITLTPAAKNFCGTDIEGAAKILEAGTDRIILKGAPTQEPIVDLTGAVSINLTPALGDPLTATYTAVITNVGSDDSGFAITGTASSGNPSNFVYKYALKLPDGWEIDNPQSFVAANKLTYTSVIDPVKGYIFEFNEDLNFQEKITLTGKLKFTGALGSIECNNADFTFGDIQQEVYTNFTPEGNCPIATSPACAGMELLTKTHSTPFNLSKISPTGAAEMAFCEDLTVSGISTPTLANVTPLLGRTGILEWYRDAGLTQSISNPSAEILVTETDYYAANRLVEGSDCLSAPLKVRVYLEKTPTANAGADQLKYNNGTFTLAANKPDRSESTNTGSSGKWTVVPAGAATFVDNTLYNTNVTIPVGTRATLTWTVTNSCGVSVSDEIVVTSMTAKLTIEKTGSAVIEKTGDGRHSAGDLIEYRFKVTNSGQAVIKAPIRIIDNKLSGWAAPGKIVSNADLAPGDILEVSEVGEYIVSLTDMNAGKVENIAKATGTTPKGIGPNGGETNGVVVTSPDGKTTTPLIPETGLSLIKSITAIGGNSKAGDEITFTFTVTNTGNVSVHTLRLTDGMLGLSNSALNFDPARIDPGQTSTGTRKYRLTQDDLDAGFIENTATITGTPTNGAKPSDVSDTGTDPKGNIIANPGADGRHDDPTVLELVQSPSLDLTKEGVYKGNSASAQVGDEVEYTFVVKNTGNVTLKGVTVSEDLTKFSGTGAKPVLSAAVGLPAGNTAASLAPGATLTYTATYLLTQEDINAGGVYNQAVAKAKDLNGGDVEDKSTDPTPLKPGDPGYDPNCADCTFVGTPQSPSLDLTKEGVYKGNSASAQVGDAIDYTFVVTNTGNVTLTGVTVSEESFSGTGTKPVLSGPIGDPTGNTAASLAPGATLTYTATYLLTQEDINAGGVYNQAVAKAKDPNGGDVEDKSTDPTPLKPGDPGYDPNCADCTFAGTPQSPSLDLTKEGVYKGNSASAAVGDAIDYTFVVTNTGNVTLTDVTVSEDLTKFSGTGAKPVLSAAVGLPAGNTAASLAPGATLTYTATYLLTQEDINAGGVYNQAVATAKDPNGGDVEDKSTDPTPLDPTDPNYDPNCADCTFVGTPQSPSLDLTKEGVYKGNSASAQVGDAIDYTFVVTNTGNVTLTDVTVSEDLTKFSGTGAKPVLSAAVGLPAGNTAASLAPGATLTYTATYLLTQEDINAGGVYNQAVATAKDPNGGDVEDKSTDPTPLDPTDPNYDPNCADCTFVGTPQSPSLDLTKEGVYKGNSASAQVGDAIDYTFVVTNTGNVTLTGVTVSEDLTKFSGTGAKPVLSAAVGLPAGNTAASLAPGATLTYTATYLLTQEDINAGGVYNQAVAKAKDPNGGDVEDKSTDPTPLKPGDPGYDPNCADCTFVGTPQSLSLDLTKEGVYKGNSASAQVGDAIDYTFVVTNTGNVTLTDVTVSEDLTKFSGTGAKPVLSAAVGLPAGNTAASLAPGATLTYTATYLLTQEDINAGGVYNQAIAKAKDPNGGDVEDKSTDPTPLDPTDPNYDPNCADCTFVGTPQSPSLDLTKEGVYKGNSASAQVGDAIDYTFVVTNTGNVTLTDVTVSEDLTKFSGTGAKPVLSAAVGLPAGNTAASLAPGATLTYTATYLLTQEDINAGGVYNQAIAKAKDPNGGDVEDKSTDPTPLKPGDPGYDPNCADCTFVGTPQSPSLDLTKEGVYKGNSASAQVGDAIDYTFVVTNTGNVTLTGVTVSEESFSGTGTKPVLSGPIGDPAGNTAASLTPGATLTYTATYLLTQEDINAGGVYNQAVATAKDPNGGDVEDKSTDPTPLDPTDPNYDPNCADCTFVGTPQSPSLDLTKEGVYKGNSASAQVGDAIDYTFVVTNTGNVTLTDVTVSEESFSGTGTKPVLSGPIGDPAGNTAASLAPGATLTYTATYLLTQEDINAGGVYNQAIAKAKDPNGGDVEDKSTDPTPLKPGDSGYDPNCADCTFVATPQIPSLTLVKSAGVIQDVNKDGRHSAGDKITYTFEVTNTGNVTIKDLVLTDAKLGLNKISFVPSELAPSKSTTYEFVYTLKQDDLDAGKVVNTALAEGTDPQKNLVTDDSDTGTDPKGNKIDNPENVDSDGDNNPGNDPTVTDLNQLGAIQVIKTADNSERYRYVGERIVYKIEVRNIGNVTLTDVKVTDNNADIKDLGTILSLAAGDSKTFTAYHTIKQADMDRGYVSNIATATGTDPNNKLVTDDSESGNTPEPGDPTDPNCKDCTITPLPAKPIEAVNDGVFEINGSTGGTTPGAVANDLLNNILVKPGEVIFEWLDTAPSGLTLNADGTITVAPGTPRAEHTLLYKICEVRNPNNCDDAYVKIVVEVAPIVAEDDEFKISWSRDGVITPSVLDNDKLDDKLVNPADVTLKPGTPSNPGLSMNPDGTITIAPSTRPGTYTYPYTICEILNPTNCSTAVATIVIEASNVFIPNTFTPNGDGTNDTFEIVGIENYDQVGITIVNRWGNEVYRNEHYDNSWNGAGLNEGTYYYIITLKKGGQEEVRKGWVLIKTR